MYKDVWKKFGMKVFIAVCSVLLLGGVAIAAPRLRANGTILLQDAVTIEAVSLPYEVGADGKGVAKLPQFVKLTFADGSEESLERGIDFEVENEDAAISNVNQVANLTIGKSSNPASKLSADSTPRQNVEFRLTQADFLNARDVKVVLSIDDYNRAAEKNLTNPEGDNNYWVVDTLPAAFDTNKWEVYYNHPTYGKITLQPNVDYTVPANATVLGDSYKQQLILTNYTAVPTVSAKVFKNIGSNEVVPTYDETNKKVVVTDTGEGTTLTLETEYYLENNTGSTCDIVGNESYSYVGRKTYTYPAAPTNFNPGFTPYTIYYDDVKTIENPPADVWHTKEDGTQVGLVYGRDYTIRNYRVRKNNVDAPGATAGTVYMDFVGQGDYNGVITKNYTLKRKLEDNPNLDIQLVPRNENESFEYDGNWHEKYPVVKFTDSNELLEAGVDYDLTYTLEKKIGGTVGPTKDITQLKDAGTVSVTIDGLGYYEGNLVGDFEKKYLQYSITSKNVEDGTRELVMEQSVFELTDDVKEKIFDKVYIQQVPSTNTTQKVSNIPGCSLNNCTFSYDEDGNNPIPDTAWSGGLKPNTPYYIQVSFSGNYTGTLPAEFQIQEYQESYVHIVFAACEECGAAAGETQTHIYTGEAHQPEIQRVYYQAPGTPVTEILPDVYEGKVTYSGQVNVGTLEVSVPVSDKLTIPKKLRINARDLTDGTITFSDKDDFYNDNGVKHEYSGYTNLPTITELALTNTSDGKTLTLKDTDYSVGRLYEYDSTTQTVIESKSITAAEVVAGKPYCYRVSRVGNNLTVPGGNYTYTEPFEFVARHINASGEKGIVFKIKPKPELTTTGLYLNWIKQNLVITDKKFGETLRSQDYSITASDIDDTSRIDVDSVVEFTVHGEGGYDLEKTKLELYVGTNITLTMLKEKGYEDTAITRDPIPEDQVESVSGSVKLTDSYGNINNLPFLKVGGIDDKSNISLHYYRAGSRVPVVLYESTSGSAEGQYHTYVKSSTPEPDDPNDANGPRYSTVVITGKSGYYGSITVKVEVKKTDFKDGKGDYEIRFRNTKEAEDNTYLGVGIGVEPEFDVVLKTADPDRNKWTENDVLILNQDYEIPKDGWANNENANELKSGTSNRATLTINGIYGYSGKITKDFTIYKRNIGVKSMVTNPDGTSAGERWVLNEGDGFRIEGWAANRSYDYTPSTKTVKGEKNGVCPQLKLYYKNQLLVEGTDYTLNYEKYFNAKCFDDDGVTYEDLPKVYFQTVSGNMNSNFKGEFKDTFEIQPIILTNENKCKVSLSYDRTVFTGVQMRPTVKIVLYRDGDKTKPWEIEYVPNGGDFDLDYIEDRFISVGGGNGSDPDNAFLTHVTVKGKGNLQGSVPKPYVIYGEFEPTGYGARNSKMVVEPKTLEYSPNATAEDMRLGCKVTYYEKQDGQGDDAYDDPNKVLGRKHVLNEAEYKVTVANRIGNHRKARVESAVEYLDGGQDFEMTIRGDLEKEYIKYTVKPIDYSGASTVALNNFLTVTYDTANGGTQELSYDTDYIFDGTPTAKLGKNTIKIIPKPGVSDDYLLNSRLIEYYVTANLSGLKLTNVRDTYPYAHGQAVINPQDIRVELNGQVLDYGVDYKVEIVGGAVNVGTHTIKIIGLNEEIYSGTKEQSFTITPYDLKDAVKDKIITVNYEETPVYTGGTVVPKVAAVTIATSSGSLYTLSNGSDRAAEYVVEAGGKGDHVNWTSGEIKPNFIISGRGNYVGEVSYEYSIMRKDISDRDTVIVTPIEDLYYNNGKDITPVPAIKYNDRDLAGILYSGNANDYVNWDNYSMHFTYQYSTEIDLKSTGRKTIHIRGIGNFTGDRTVEYTVKPLNIKDAELVFTGETPVYDGEKQWPAFQLMYAGDKILEWTGSKVLSDYIKSADVFFDNCIDATDEEPATVKVTIVGENDNYEYGSYKEATFTILPASLANHTKFLYRPKGENENRDLSKYKLNLDFAGVGITVKPQFANADTELEENQLGIYYDYLQKKNHDAFLVPEQDYTIEYKYVEPDTDDVDVREEYQDPDISYAGKVKVTITGRGNYADTASFWYYIGKDISSDATISMNPTTAVYNSQAQAPNVKVSGVGDLSYIIAKYKNEVAVENLIEDRDFVNAGNYYIRIEGDPKEGTYATKPYTLTFTITPRALSNSLVIDGFKKEYKYTGYEICPVGISVTDYIDNVKYRLTEDVDYTLTYTNNINAGTAYINIKAQNNFSGTATANFMITSSTISSGGSGGSNSFLNQGTGEISGAVAVSPSNVTLAMDTLDAMYYTGRAVYPKVSIAGMTENIDYTVTFSNNVEVGTAIATINGIGNNTGSITKNFRIIAQLSKCTVAPIPAQQYTGSPVTPTITVTCGNSVLMEGTDYTVSYANNVNIGTATATIRALNNANYTGTTTATFSIGNDVGGFIISGFAPSYTYTGSAITPGVVVETGSRTLVQGTDYTVSYSNNVNAGTATITVTGTGRYSGTQTAEFVIEPKNIQGCDATDITDRTYTGDAYTPDVTVSDGGKVLQNGVDYTVTYANNTDPGTASIVIKGASNNYSGTKVISFKISAVAVKGLKASSVKYNSLKLKWTKQGYADGYQICNSNSKVVKNVKTNSASITGLKAGNTYKYKVRSYIRNADGTKSYGAFSPVITATTKLRTPTVKVASNAKGQARISWSKVSGASGYEIYYKKSSNAKYKKLKTVNNPNVRVCTVRGMNSGDRAYFRIRAFKNSGSKKVYSALNPLKVITVK